MASTSDSGIDTGNESNDSFLQDKISKMDLEMLPHLKPDDLKNESTICDNNETADKVSSSKMTEVSSSTTSTSPSSCQADFSQETKLNHVFNCFVLTGKEFKELFVPYGSGNSSRNSVSDIQCHVRHARRIRCFRRSPYNPTGIRKELFKMCRAVSHNNTDYVRELLMAGVSPNCYDSLKRTPLHLAACMGFVDMVKLLLDHGADPNAKDSIGNIPLHLAACTNHVKVISLLMQAGTRLGEKDLAGHSPIQLAITKLNIMKRAARPNPVLQEQITQVVQMMSEHMKRKEQVEPALLSRLFSVMKVKDSSEEMEHNLQDLLSNLSLSNSS